MAVRQLHSGRNLHSCRLRGALWASMGPGEPHRPAPAGSAGSGGLCGPLWAPASPAGRLRPAPAGSGRLQDSPTGAPAAGARRESSTTRRVSVVVLRTTTLTRVTQKKRDMSREKSVTCHAAAQH